MKPKFVMTLVLSATLVAMIVGHPVFGNASNNLLPEHFLLPGRIEETGTYFEIKDSEYLNIVLTSDKEIKALLESFPKIISLTIESPADNSSSVVLTIKGLESNKTYYKYQDSYKNGAVFVSDENGNYAWTQDLSKPHHVWIQEEKGTTFISEDTVLENDIAGSVEITADNITLDCNGHTITGTGNTGYGVNLYERRGVAVKNCNIFDSSSSINIFLSSEIFIANNTLNGSGSAGVGLAHSFYINFTSNEISGHSTGINSYISNNNIYVENNIKGCDFAGINLNKSDSNVLASNNIADCEYGIDVYNSDNNTLTGNSIFGSGFTGVDFFKGSDNNTLVGNTIENSFYGVDINRSQNNKIYHNNFINNQQQVSFYDGIGNLFDNGYPLGGNYWSDYIGQDLKKGPSQDQTGGDGIGDTSYVFDGGQDNYPFMQENGWDIPINQKNPVLIVPGIAGTELWNEDEHIWANLGRMFRDVGDYFLTENLSLDENGNSVKEISLGDVIKRKIALLIFDQNIFEALEQSLILNAYELNKDLFYFPYDWRLDLNNTKDLLKQKIDEIKLQTNSSKVDIIAHSMGGLLTKAYIESYRKNSVDKLIFVGTPHLGAPKAGKTLLEGDNFWIPWLRQKRVKELALNMPSLHQLLPNQTYFNEFQGYIKPFAFFTNPPLYDYEQTKDYFINDKSKNPIMFNKAEDFFSKNLDQLDLSSIDAYNIAGCKSSTQAAYKMSFFGNIGSVGYSSGDGTAPLASANYLSIPEINKYYVKNGKHSELPSTNGVRELILDILNNQNPSLSGNASSNSDFCSFKGKSMTWRSPVAVHIYDQFQNHTGPTENNGIEYGIPGADYEIINGQKFVFLPTDEEQEYTINGIGENEGSFDLLISEIDNGAILNTYVYNDVPIMPGSQINFDISENSDDAVIEYDFENLGQFYGIEADAILDGAESDDLIPPKTQVVLTGKERKDGTFVSNVLVELEAGDDLSGVLETWYSLDGISFKKYADSFVLKRRNVYNLYYYSTDRAGNNEEVNVLQIKVGITQKQFEKCRQKGKCSKIFKHGKKSELEFKDIKKEFFNEIKNAKKNKKR